MPNSSAVRLTLPSQRCRARRRYALSLRHHQLQGRDRLVVLAWVKALLRRVFQRFVQNSRFAHHHRLLHVGAQFADIACQLRAMM